MDIGGHSPIPLGAPPFPLSFFQFQHNLLFLVVFRVLNFRSHFEALNDVFWASHLQQISFNSRMDICGEIFSPRIDIYNDVSCVSNRDSMPKLHPWEVETPVYPNGAHSVRASSPRVRFLDVEGSPLFLNNKYALDPHCNAVQRPVAATSLLRDSYQCPS